MSAENQDRLPESGSTQRAVAASEETERVLRQATAVREVLVTFNIPLEKLPEVVRILESLGSENIA